VAAIRGAGWRLRARDARHGRNLLTYRQARLRVWTFVAGR
jgi:hypothetical protein